MAEPKIPYRDKRTQEQVVLDRAPRGGIQQGRSRMQEIIGQGLEGLVDFLTPSTDPAEIGLDLSPLGKLAGLIPARMIKPLVERLNRQVERAAFAPDVRQALFDQIERYPEAAAHLETIQVVPNEMSHAGQYAAINKSARERLEYLQNYPKEAEYQIAKTLDESGGPGTQSSLEVRQKNPMAYGNPSVSIPAHEFEHLRQDLDDPLAFPDAIGWKDPYERLKHKYTQFPYNNNPYEVMANAMADPRNQGEIGNKAIAEWAINGMPFYSDNLRKNYLTQLSELLNARGKRFAVEFPAWGQYYKSSAPLHQLRIEDIVAPKQKSW